MIASIHQLNYFPWIGYFNKVAKSDKFIILDDVQLTDSNMMHRNRYINKNGEISYITIAFNKKDYMKRSFLEIETNQNVDWQTRQYNALIDAYRKAPYLDETMELILPIFKEKYSRVIEVNLKAFNMIMNALDINTDIVFQSELVKGSTLKKDDLLIDLLKRVDADVYLSGNGAKKYMQIEDFSNESIGVQFQTFVIPEYNQCNSESFEGGLSILDMLFNIGIQNTKTIFWDYLYRREETIYV